MLIFRNVKLFGYTVIANFFLRIIMYVVCGAVMHGYVPNYMNITEEQLNSNHFVYNHHFYNEFF